MFLAVINKPIFLNKKDKPALVNRKIGVSGAQPLTQTGEENTHARVSFSKKHFKYCKKFSFPLSYCYTNPP